MDSETASDFKAGAGALTLWLGLLAGPVAVLLQLQINYALVPRVCSSGREWALHLVAFLALAVTVVVGLLSWRNWRRTGPRRADDGAGVVPRSRFMAAVGILISALMTLVIVAQWLPIFIYGTCDR